MNKKWQSRLEGLLKEKNTLHNTTTTLREAPAGAPSRYRDAGLVKTETDQNPTAKTAKTLLGDSAFSENAQSPTAKTAETANGYKDGASELSLIATWSREFGYVSIHDPTAGEWYDLRTKDAPDWAVREARRRKELYKDGNRKAYRLTSREMEEDWEAERVPESEGIVEDHPVEEEA